MSTSFKLIVYQKFFCYNINYLFNIWTVWSNNHSFTTTTGTTAAQDQQQQQQQHQHATVPATTSTAVTASSTTPTASSTTTTRKNINEYNFFIFYFEMMNLLHLMALSKKFKIKFCCVAQNKEKFRMHLNFHQIKHLNFFKLKARVLLYLNSFSRGAGILCFDYLQKRKQG